MNDENEEKIQITDENYLIENININKKNTYN